MKSIITAFLLAGIPLVADAGVTRARYLMGTVCEITTSDQHDIDPAFSEAARIEAVLSTWTATSDLSRLNDQREMRVSPELRQLIATVMDWSDRTHGAFNPLVRPLVDAWRTRDNGALPSREKLTRATRAADLRNLSLGSDGRIRLQNGAQIEEGAFGKGYALDRMLALMTGPRVIINFGGQLLIRGTATVSVADPEQRDRPAVEFTMRDSSLSTTSGSEKSFLVGGRRFSHIFDPRTGEALPPRGSVSVLSSSALTADILSTALYVMGSDEGLRWARRMGVAALFIDSDHIVRTSSEFRARARDLQLLDSHFVLRD